MPCTTRSKCIVSFYQSSSSVFLVSKKLKIEKKIVSKDSNGAQAGSLKTTQHQVRSGSQPYILMMMDVSGFLPDRGSKDWVLYKVLSLYPRRHEDLTVFRCQSKGRTSLSVGRPTIEPECSERYAGALPTRLTLLLPQRASLKRASQAAFYLVHGVQKFKMQSIMVGNILTNIPCAPNGIYLMFNRFFDSLFSLSLDERI